VLQLKRAGVSVKREQRGEEEEEEEVEDRQLDEISSARACVVDYMEQHAHLFDAYLSAVFIYIHVYMYVSVYIHIYI